MTSVRERTWGTRTGRFARSTWSRPSSSRPSTSRNRNSRALNAWFWVEGRDSVAHGQPAQKAAHVAHFGALRAELARQAAQEPADPADVGLLRPSAVMARPQDLAQAGDEPHPLCSQLGLLGRSEERR